MRARHRHLTLGRSGALACWDARALTQADNAGIASWTDRAASITANANTTPVVRRAIQGGQPIVRFASNSTFMETGSVSVTANKAAITIVAVASSTAATGAGYQTVVQSRTSGASTRAGVYLRSSKAEAGGRRLVANSYQFVQTGTAANSTFYVVAGVFHWAGAALWAYLSGSGTSRTGGFQTAGNSENASSVISLGAFGNTTEALLGDIGIVAFIETASSPLRRRFEHAAAYSYKLACA